MNKFSIKSSKKGRKTVKRNLHYTLDNKKRTFNWSLVVPRPVQIIGDVNRICPHGGQSDGGDLVGDIPGVSEARDKLELQEPGDVDREAEEE